MCRAPRDCSNNCCLVWSAPAARTLQQVLTGVVPAFYPPDKGSVVSHDTLNEKRSPFWKHRACVSTWTQGRDLGTDAKHRAHTHTKLYIHTHTFKLTIPTSHIHTHTKLHTHTHAHLQIAPTPTRECTGSELMVH